MHHRIRCFLDSLNMLCSYFGILASCMQWPENGCRGHVMDTARAADFPGLPRMSVTSPCTVTHPGTEPGFNFDSFYAPLSCFLSFTTLLKVTLNSIITEQLDILKLHYFFLWYHCHIVIKDTILLLNAFLGLTYKSPLLDGPGIRYMFSFTGSISILQSIIYPTYVKC